MRALKALVVIMGVLLVAGSVTLAVLIMSRIGSHRSPVARTTSPAAGLPDRVAVTLPPGAELRSVTVLGDRLALHVATPAGAEILVVDPASGAITETIELKQASP
jgi:hypothetical protein